MKSFMFIFMIALMAVSATSVFAQGAVNGINQGEYDFTIDVETNGLTVSQNGALEVDGLPAGQTVALVPDGAGSYLAGASGGIGNAPNLAIVTWDFAQVTGDPFAEILVSFALPYTLVSASGQGNIRVAYNGTSACWFDPDAAATIFYFDPTKDTRMTVGTLGNCAIYLGGIFTVSKDVNIAEAYIGEALFTVGYTGN